MSGPLSLRERARVRGNAHPAFHLHAILTSVTVEGNIMGKIRRGGYVFLAWAGDHGPRHVHVYRNGRLVVKWDPDHNVAMEGEASRTILRLIAELREEGRL